MQPRRLLLVFAFALGVSALLAALAPPPSTRENDDRRPPVARETGMRGAAPRDPALLRLSARDRPNRPVPVRRAAPQSRVSLEVRVPRPGDVELRGLGLRQSADPRAPARFDLLSPAGRYDVVYHPVRGRSRVIGRLAFRARPGRTGR